MVALKTRKNDKDVVEFINEFAESEAKREDALKLLKFMQEYTGFEPKMWGDSIIGFGEYHYKSDRSTQEGDWPLVGFSPRKTAISLYVYTGMPEHEYLLEGLGKYKMGKACIYVKKLSDIDLHVVQIIMDASIAFLKKTYGDQ